MPARRVGGDDSAGSLRAVLLDALGTLVELQPPAPLLARELSARFGIDVSLERAEEAIAAEIAYYRAHLDQGRDAASLVALRRHCAQVVRESLSLSPRLDLTETLLASLQFRLYPDVRPVLKAWRVRGLRLVVVSNWDVSLPAVLERLGVSDGLDAVLTSAEVGARKPAPEIFRAALDAAAVAAEHAIHVGDRLDEDVAGARAAGIEPIWLRRVPTGPPPDGVRTAASLSELRDIV